MDQFRILEKRLGVISDDQRINLKLSLQAAGYSLSLLLGSKSSDMDPVATPARQINGLHPDIGILAPESSRQSLGIGLLGKGRHLNLEIPHGPWPPLIGHNLDLNLVRSIADHAKGLGTGLG